MSASRRAARLVRCRPRPSIPRAQRETTLTFTAVRRTSGKSASRVSASCCLESLSAPSVRTSRTSSASRSNSTAAATSGPARQPRPASSAPATQRTPRLRSNWKRRRPARRLARWLGPRPDSEEPEAAGRPVRGEGATDDRLARDRAPEPAVVGLPTIVAHHEPVPGRNGDRRWHGAPAGHVVRAGVRDVRVVLALAVADHVAVDDPDRVARAGHDALDEVDLRLAGGRAVARGVLLAAPVAAGVGLRAGGRVEDDDVADLRVAEAVAEAVDEHALADLERRDHRLARDPVGLDEERRDAEPQPEGDDDDDDELHQRSARRLLLWPGPHAQPRVYGRPGSVRDAQRSVRRTTSTATSSRRPPGACSSASATARRAIAAAPSSSTGCSASASAGGASGRSARASVMPSV